MIKSHVWLFIVKTHITMQIENYTVELRDVHLYAHHGVMPQEREIGAWFTIDIKLEIDDCSCAESDLIDGTVSYADVYDVVVKEMAQPSKLLENVAHRIMERIFASFGSVTDVVISVTKDTPPMGGDRLSASVRLKAKRD